MGALASSRYIRARKDAPPLAELSKRGSVVILAAASCWILAFFLPGGVVSMVFFQAGLIPLLLFGTSVALTIKFSNALGTKIAALDHSAGLSDWTSKHLAERSIVATDELNVVLSKTLPDSYLEWDRVRAFGGQHREVCEKLLVDHEKEHRDDL